MPLFYPIGLLGAVIKAGPLTIAKAGAADNSASFTVNLGDSDTDLFVLVAVHQLIASGDVVPTGVAVGGVALTKVAEFTGSGQYHSKCSYWLAKVSAGGASASVVLSGSSIGQYVTMVYVVRGSDNTAYDHGTYYEASPSEPSFTISANTAAGGVMVAVADIDLPAGTITGGTRTETRNYGYIAPYDYYADFSTYEATSAEAPHTMTGSEVTWFVSCVTLKP